MTGLVSGGTEYWEAGDSNVEPNERFPSLIDCLDTGDHGLVLDLSLPVGHTDGTEPATVVSGPFSKRIFARVKTDSGDSIAPVLLVMQRSHYNPPHSLSPINNLRLEKAWQNALDYHSRTGSSVSPIILKDQVSPKGELRAFAPLFRCQHTSQWFHPVCPQCGMTLTLCRDDAVLKKRGLPGYSDSLSRFMHCESCTQLSDSAPFFCPRKEAGMPAIVHDQDALILQWKQLLARLPQDAALPCRGCPEAAGCYETGDFATDRIHPLAFFPFYLMILPAPTLGGVDFLRALSGDVIDALPGQTDAKASLMNRFFFQQQDRQFLEILYLKLTFLQQVTEQLIDPEGAQQIQEFDFSLDSIGVDWIPAGTGLPAYWHFNARMLDSVGSFQASPFAPAMPEGSRLHFLAAVWFHALLVNSQQGADAVFAEVVSLLQKVNSGEELDALVARLAESDSPIAGRQIHWTPEGKRFPRHWVGYWQQALKLGLQLVRTGMKAGAPWDGTRFCDALTDLREKIKAELFSEQSAAMPTSLQTDQSPRLRAVLGDILDKWQAKQKSDADMPLQVPPADEATMVPARPSEDPGEPAAARSISDAQPPQPSIPDSQGQRPEPSDWNADIEETIVLSSPDSAPSDGTPLPPTADSTWDDDIEETVVLQGGGVAPASQAPAAEEDVDQTVVISPAANEMPAQPAPPDDDMAATLVQGPAEPTPAHAGRQDTDLDATVVINTGSKVPVDNAKPDSEDDLEATLVQGAVRGPAAAPADSSPPGGPGRIPAPKFKSEADLEATVVINPVKIGRASCRERV